MRDRFAGGTIGFRTVRRRTRCGISCWGRAALRVSELCLGTMSFGDVWGFGAPERSPSGIMDGFAEAGGNFPRHGEQVPRASPRRSSAAYLGAPTGTAGWWRQKFTPQQCVSGDPNAAGNSRKNLRQSPRASLRRLRTDYVDVLWVHAWDYCTPVDEVMRALDDAVAAGKVRCRGALDSPAWVAAEANTLAALRGWTPFVALQVEYSLLERTAERELLPLARAHGLTVTAWAPMGAGILTGKYTRSTNSDSKRAEANADRLSERNLTVAREVDRIAEELGATPAQVAIAWVRHRGPRVIPITGVRTPAQMDEVLAGVGLHLADEQQARLEEVSRIDYGFPYDLLRGPQGQMVYGDREAQIDLPPDAPRRWAS